MALSYSSGAIFDHNEIVTATEVLGHLLDRDGFLAADLAIHKFLLAL
ncbi:MAG: hypothetical protein KGO52_05445 [Nitrospirota bacterium]|nr:hypothetical protein [Nitrospirota bacterium]MDE3242147.1 hypothetical protein [Nitrospirota bacterium]